MNLAFNNCRSHCKQILLLFTVLSALFCIETSLAEIYQWKDKQGRVHFSDEPPADEAHETKTIRYHGASQSEQSERSIEQQNQRYLRALEAEKRTQALANEKAERLKDKQKKQVCSTLQDEARKAREGYGYYQLNEQGEKEFYTEKQAEKMREELILQYEAECL